MNDANNNNNNSSSSSSSSSSSKAASTNQKRIGAWRAFVVMLSFVLFLVTAYTASFLRIEVKYDPDRWKQWPARDDDGRDGGANTTASAEEGDGNGLLDTRIERGGALSPSDAIEDKGVRAVGVDRAEEEEEQQQQTAEKTVERRYPSRTRLLFNHLPKAGGKYAINVLKEHVPWETVKIVSEFRKSTETDRKTHFIIANIREVCSYYMSLFHYGVQYGGNLKNQFEFKVFPKNPELRNIYRDENDVENFHKWLRVIKGIWSRRIRRSHPDLAVDCWVRTSSLDEDLAHCLQQYQSQGGKLKATAPEFLDKFIKHDGGALLDERVHPSAYDHSCTYFFNETQRNDVQEYEKMTCELLKDGCNCCGTLQSPPFRDGAKWRTPDRGEYKEIQLWDLPHGYVPGSLAELKAKASRLRARSIG